MNKAEAGRLGGIKTAAKYGPGHMARIGAKGAEVLWSKYRLTTVGQSGWGLIDRETGALVKTWGCARLLTIMQQRDYDLHNGGEL